MIKKMECIPYTDLFRFARRVKRNFPFGMLALSVKVFYVVAYLYPLYNELSVYVYYLTNEFNKSMDNTKYQMLIWSIEDETLEICNLMKKEWFCLTFFKRM